MFKRFLSDVSLHRTNALSCKIGGKNLYIESDDWGMLRMRSKEIKSELIKKGYKIPECIFNSYDRLENNEDIEGLMDVLNSVRDLNGNPALMVLNNIVGNPDFQNIEKSGFENYFYEDFTETYNQYNDTGKVLYFMKEGIKSGCFLPQFHGREHVHVNNWMRSLRSKDKLALEGFHYGMFSITSGVGSNCKREFLDAMAIYDDADKKINHQSIHDGLTIFRNIWGYASKSAIAPCYIWNDEIEKILKENQIDFIQSGRSQIIPGLDKNKVIRRITGQKNKFNQTYSVRNIYFEPSTNMTLDWVDYGLSQINNAFMWGAPAIINSHRVNYIGGIEPSNRDFGLLALKKLLFEVKKRWPDVNFIHPFIN